MNYRRFKIKASLEDKEICYWVKIFKTKGEMNEYRKSEDSKAGKELDDGEAEGYCQKWNAINVETGELNPCIGQILLYEGKMGGSLVAHEVCHAAWWAYDTLTGNTAIENIGQEEQLCHLMSDLYHETVSRMYKSGMWEK